MTFGPVGKSQGNHMVDTKILKRATLVGMVLQVAMVVLGHFISWIAQNAYVFGGMFISGVSGLLYARDYAAGYGPGALGGAIAGPSCLAVGVAVAIALREAKPEIIPFAVLTGIVIGAIGGLFGQMGANMRAAIGPRR
jgi:hypothetical protein